MSIFTKLRSVFSSKSSADLSTSYAIGPYSIAFTADGTPVNDWTALSVATVYQCATVLSNGVSQVPFTLMRENGERRTSATEHPLYALFRRKPNPWQTSFEFRQMVMLWLTLHGEVPVWIIRAMGKVKRLIPFAPDQYTFIENYEGGWAKRTYYFNKDNGEQVAVPEKDVWLLRWQPYNRRDGMPKIDLLRSAVATALKQNRHASVMLDNNAQFPGILTSKITLTPEQSARVSKAWQENTTGANAGKTPVLGADLDFKSIGQTATDAQYVENRKFQIEEICRFFGVNPFMVFQYENTNSYASSEQFMLQHLTHTLAPWYTMIEESATANLLSEDETKKGYYFMFNDNALLRTDARTRFEGYHTGIYSGFMTPNEARAKEDLPPLEGGDKLYIQGATIPLIDAGKLQEAQKPKTENTSSDENKKPEEDTDEE